jgi:HAD superfamily hydrolase (TIGR01509 family)
MINAIVFDFDGVIIDTETPDFVTWQETFAAHGVELDRAFYSTFIGGRENFDFYQHLEELCGTRLDRETLRQKRRKQFLERIDANPLLPGILDYILGAKELGLKIAVASSSDRAWVEGHLQNRNLLHHFDAIRTGDEVKRAKPDPELYLTAVSHLGTEPRMAIAIEDSANGVTAAKSAGLFCVVVPNPMTSELPTSHADLRLSSLADVSLAELMGIASKTLT